MIAKYREFPIKITVCEALKRRLHPNHPKLGQIIEECGMKYSGYYGEESIQYHLDILSEKRYHILHDLRLFNGKNYFQIDTIILSPIFIFILEVKNYSGHLYLDSKFNQLIRTTTNGTRDIFNDPVLQAERQQFELQRWLRRQKYEDIQFDNLVVFTHRKCEINTYNGNEQVFQKVCKSPDLANRIIKKETFYSVENICSKTLSKITKLLIKHHTPETSKEILDHFQIKQQDVITGVQCTECKKFPMNYVRGLWICKNCGTKSKTAHIQAINDYFLLIKPTINNFELRQFLHIQSEKTAQRILQSLNLSSSGYKKTKIYFNNKEFQDTK